MHPRLSSVMATGLLFLLVGLLGAPAAQAVAPGGSAPQAGPLATSEEPSEAIRGTVRAPNGDPVTDVAVRVEADGEEVGETTSDQEGAWQVEVPGPGTYTVTLDTDTLPGRLKLRNEGGETLEGVEVRPGSQRTVIFPLIPGRQQQEGPTEAPDGSEGSDDSGTPTESADDIGEDGGVMAPTDDGRRGFGGRFAQMFVEGLQLGVIIAITSVGLSLVFGTTRLINFAHGEMVTVGAVVAFWFSTRPGDLPLILATVLAVVVGALLGGGMERGVWRPMRARGSGLIQMFIISIGISLLLRHLILVALGSRRQGYDQYGIQERWHLGPIAITPRDLAVMVLSVVALLGVAYMLQRTRIGKATRAVADNRDLAESSGIDVDRVVLVVWIVGGGLAALGGVFYGLSAAVYWDMGFRLLLLMFAGVILGGLGSAYGAMVGSLVIGLVAQLSTLWFPVELQNAWALLVLIVVLVVRPQGILGRAERAG